MAGVAKVCFLALILPAVVATDDGVQQSCQNDAIENVAELSRETTLLQPTMLLDRVNTTISCGECGTTYQLTSSEIDTILNLHNQLRTCAGTGAEMRWNCDLMCQAQRHADKCQFSHSDSFNEAISAGENLASTHDGEMATWMWFSEYGGYNSPGFSSDTGHYTAMVWEATTEIGCGKCPNQVLACQYSNSPPNFGGSNDYKSNVPVFDGTKQNYEDCGMEYTEPQAKLRQFSSWGFTEAAEALSRLENSPEPSSEHGGNNDVDEGSSSSGKGGGRRRKSKGVGKGNPQRKKSLLQEEPDVQQKPFRVGVPISYDPSIEI